MDVFYYSKYCSHCNNMIRFITDNNLIEKISCICIDERKRDPKNNHIIVLLENDTSQYLPPSLQSVPALL